LPKTHVEAPTRARMLLAGILLKVGVFGAIKMVILINIRIGLVLILSLIGLLVAPIITILSSERKVIVANRRVSHINLTLYGVNVLGNVRIRGSYIICLRHGFISSTIFCFVGIIYNSTGVRILYYTTGLMRWRMFIGVIMGLILLGNAGIPPFISF